MKITAGLVKGLTTSYSGGGTDTTYATLAWWSLAMIVYPQVQERAQAELDNVVGRMRAPNFSDKSHLPFIRAMVKESIRWSRSTPIGV